MLLILIIISLKFNKYLSSNQNYFEVIKARTREK
jgi:hypothetical protein